MIVECISKILTSEQLRGAGEKYYSEQDYHVTVGKRYDVYGLDFALNENLHTAFVQHLSDYGHLSSTPMCLFKVVDNKVSRLWVAGSAGAEHFAIWPPSFFQDYYHDDLSEGVPEIVKDFEEIKSFIERENGLSLS